jgi:tRNA-specific 2-thiouridylase
VDKDQTYFLYGLRQDQLDHARFPLGELTKPEVREVARGLGLVTAEKPESQEICFVPGGDYREALRERAGWVPAAGATLDGVDGERVGEHGGTPGYTVGQRKGIGVALGRAAYVSRSTPDQHDRFGTPRTRDDDIELELASFVAGDAPPGGIRSVPRSGSAIARPRSARPCGQRRYPSARGGRWLVGTDIPVWAAAQGQAAVLYDGEVVLGGGRIAGRAGVACR